MCAQPSTRSPLAPRDRHNDSNRDTGALTILATNQPDHSMTSCTFRAPFRAACSKPKSPSPNFTSHSTYLSTRDPTFSSMCMALSNGPHRDPTNFSSATTIVAVLIGAVPAHVVLTTTVPSGRHKFMACSSPTGDPEASTTTGKACMCSAQGDCADTITFGKSDTMFSFFSCRPKCTKVHPGGKDRDSTSVIKSPSLPSPITAILSPGLGRQPCSTMRHAAARGSANTAILSGIASGTRCKFKIGSVILSAMQPSLPTMPRHLRFGQWFLAASIEPFVQVSQSRQGTLISPTTRLPTQSASSACSTMPTNS
mmetsp:Transcript_42423/g.111783  ORF Transcript_42423/g.111783 Transcript_42423/m.111783 type:complete len:311 (+) Transcript_42423:174-1106(+)